MYFDYCRFKSYFKVNVPIAIYLRMFGYILTILAHSCNAIFLSLLEAKIKIDFAIYLREHNMLLERYFSCWTISFHLLYAVLCLILDIQLLLNIDNKQYKPSKYWTDFKETFFSAILWPSSWMVSSIFWTLTIYNKRLLYPKFVDRFFVPLSNHILHTVIVGSLVWELYFQPRNVPRSHKNNLYYLAILLMIYLFVVGFTYFERGIWVYPFFGLLHGTVYYPIVPMTIVALAFLFYYLQWPLTAAVWGKESENAKTS